MVCTAGGRASAFRIFFVSRSCPDWTSPGGVRATGNEHPSGRHSREQNLEQLSVQQTKTHKIESTTRAGNQTCSSKVGVSTTGDRVPACARAIKPSTRGNRMSIPDLKELLRSAKIGHVQGRVLAYGPLGRQGRVSLCNGNRMVGYATVFNCTICHTFEFSEALLYI